MSLQGPAASDLGSVDPEERAGWPPEIRLAYDIARNLSWMDHDEHTEAVATHIRKFWEPRMRRDLALRVREGDPRVPLVVAEAVARYLQDDIDRAEIAEPSAG